MSALEIHQFPCLSDNYGYLVHDPISGETAVIDTPDADRILSEAKSKGWTITQIWNTHWHPDHTGGNLKIKEETGCVIIGPAGEEEKIPGLDRAVTEGSLVNLGTHAARVLDLPGHTLGHCAYSMEDDGLAFVGDTLFALGCGRLFEGSAEQMWNSLSKLKALPEDTAIYCAHEYTAANAKFAVTIEPENKDLSAYSERVTEHRSQNKPTVPTTISAELAANPFLRADVPELQDAMGHSGDAVATFAEIRKRKDSF
ncbi:hydroxyacylglutathione hydrolase [Ponticaulis sp.]|uniref:hydroxyacylglutathione hydrolase n=1 Tax=Ponticaulis sp. TaxID=2020902 RepID=UPI000C389933|nr:hydroxyacylglutathione hydrolase [Ponticaulis sp.]MAJ10438.1 hydroxyacylglutathione hydrolase [Ponticaulis sp.]HBH88826.1 hydroxyacylglutathione hydrolase [Hyphomonadaceae bacterium]HBJ91888.1 hydroxyacylglutathione hydrolase [Hyphomonadaceae bacterium]|tara:strand:- start:14739 stop:15506 length:768 start_codon:yes stop_codon:yes gene_type:complete